MTTLPEVVVYCDGSCSPNPGPGGWGAIIMDGTDEREISGSEPHTTNNRMELMGAIEGLVAIPGRRRVHLYSDSAYVVDCFRDGWWIRWKRRGWITKRKQPVANRDLWERLIAENQRHEVSWHWVRGHSGHPLNDRVDALACAATRAGRGDRPVVVTPVAAPEIQPSRAAIVEAEFAAQEQLQLEFFHGRAP